MFLVNSSGKFRGHRQSQARLISAVAIATLSAAQSGKAASGLYIDNATSGGTWSAPADWLNNIVASGTDSIATFNTPGAANTVHLDAPYTIGGLNFNTTSTSSVWTIDNNGSASNVLTLAVSTGVPKINVLTLNSIQTISATIAGTQGFTKSGAGAINLTASNTYSGVTTLNSTTSSAGADLYLSNNNALGTSSLYIDPGTAFNTRVLLNAGIVIPNNITINTARAQSGANGTLMTNGNIGGATFSGSITINNIAASGGHIEGPVDNTLTNFLTFSGPITLSAAYYATNGVTAPNITGKGLILRGGNEIFSGGGSYFRAELRCGELRVGATNGIATNSYLDMGINANGNPQSFAALDLNGFNQQLVGLSNLNAVGGASFSEYVTNSSTTPVTLTLAPLPASNISSGLVFDTGGTGGGGGNPAYITDNSANGGTLNLVINGDPTGVQTINSTNSTYGGTTTLTSGTLSINTLANGGAASSIGASSNLATNLIFGGGQLNYSGGSTSTDRNFTTNTGTNALLAVTTTATTLTMSGGGTGGGGLTKLGNGILLLSGSNSYTGPTLVSAGTLLVNSTPGLAAASNVTISSGATLGGTGTVAGTVTPAAGGIIAPAGFNAIGTLTVGALTLNTGSILNLEMTTGGNDEVTVANSGGLTVNGASIDLYQPGTTTTFSTNGTYPLFNVTGSIGGSVSNLSIANPAAGKIYGLTNSGGVVNLTIATASTLEYSDNAGTNNYNDAGNWIGGVVPNGLGQTALFGSNLVGSNGAVNLTTPVTVSGVIFNNSSVSYSLNGSGSFVLNNGVAAAAIDVLNGQHSINVPISLSGATALDTTNSSDVLAITGNITGAKSVAVNGPGTITLTGTNSFTTVAVNGSTLNIGSGTTGTLGTGSVSLSNAAILNFNLSGTYNFGQSITGSNTGETINKTGSSNLTVGAISSVAAVNISNGTFVGTSINTGVLNVTGNGSLTASGNVTGAAKLTINTSGVVSFSGSNSYAGGTELDAGTLTLNSANALPANSALAVNSGTLDLHGNSVSLSNILDTGAGGVITNSVASTTATVNFTGFQANYNLYAALNDGPTGGKVALVSFIGNNTSSGDGIGNEFTLISNTAGNYSGGTTVSKESIQANVTDAFGTGPITFALNDTSTNNSRLNIAGGVTLPNNIIIAQGNPYSGYGDIEYLTTTSGSATLTGSITLNADQFTGGTFSGPTNGTDVLNINGPVYTAGTATTISVRNGTVGFGGGGSYPIFDNYSTVLVNATNGLATGAQFVFFQGAPILDLNGNSQTLAGITINSGAGTVQNSNSSSPGVLTLNTTVADAYGGVITGNLSIVKAGSANLNLSGALTYTGTTQVSGGSLTFAASTGAGIQTITLPGALNLGAGTLTNLAVATATANRTLLSIGSLTIAGSTNTSTGLLDLANNDLDIQSGSLITLGNQLHQGFANGNWNGSGGIISTVAAANATHLTALGSMQNNQSGTALYTGSNTFDGVTPGTADLLVKYTYYGDANLDGKVDASDYSLIDSGFLTHSTGWFNGDFNYDGVVNGSDYTLIDNAFNTQGALIASEFASPLATATAEIAGSSAVPEPTTLTFFGLGVAGLLGRRSSRRRR